MPAPDRALKRLVADLARADEDDIEAVLDALDPRQRRTVEALLASYRGEADVSALQGMPAHPIVIEGLSPWLMARLERRMQSGAGRPGGFGELVGADAREAGLVYTITEAAFETLQACAASLEDIPAPSRNTGVRRRLLGARPL